MRGLREFVPGGFPLPASPIYDGMGSLREFVAAYFPLPQNPVRFIAAADGQLPKAPDLTQADIHGEDDGLGCGCGGSCAGCSGMGAFDFANLIPGTTFNVPNTYLVAAAIAAVFIISSAGAGGGGGRRRRNPARRSNPARRRRASAKRRRR